MIRSAEDMRKIFSQNIEETFFNNLKDRIFNGIQAAASNDNTSYRIKFTLVNISNYIEFVKRLGSLFTEQGFEIAGSTSHTLESYTLLITW